MIITKESELGTALKENKDTIIIEGDLSKKVFKIKITGKITWGVCVSGLAIAIASFSLTGAGGGAPAPVALPVGVAGLVSVAPVACSTLGLSATYSAILIAMAGGGIASLNKLRKYKLEKISDSLVILHRK